MSSRTDPSTPHEESEAARRLHLCVLLARILFKFGATTRRIQESVSYLARRLGCKVDMLVSYDALLLSVHDGAGVRTQIASSQGAASLNMIGLMRIGEWLRGLSGTQSSQAELERALTAISEQSHSHALIAQMLAAGCAGAGFCITNGGDPVSWICSFLASAFIFLIRRPLAKRHVNVHLTIFTIALAGSFLAAILARLTHTTTPAVALLAPLLFLVPGLPLITGGIDIVRNHVTIGVARIGFALAILVALCLGVGLTLPMVPSQAGPQFSLPGNWDVLVFPLAAGLAAGAIGLLNNGNLRLIALCAGGGFTARLVRALLGLEGVDPITGTLFGVVCSTVLIATISRRLHWPAIVAAVIAALPMVPGYFAIDGFHSLLLFSAASGADPAQLAAAVHALTRAVFISTALVVGTIGPAIVLKCDTDRALEK